MNERRNPWRDAGWLTVLCLFVYGAGMTSFGLANGHEATRALTAREMYTANEWLVPHFRGVPYITKPPLFYWLQMLVGHVRGWFGAVPFSDESEVRIAAALAGLAGVLVTYFAARRLLATPSRPREGDDAAWLGALGLATGVLYVRSSRIGELDILIVPFVVAAVWLVVEAWKHSDAKGRTAWGLIAGATLAGAGAAMTKGPPAILTIALAAYGWLVWRVIAASSARDRVTAKFKRIGMVAGALMLMLPRMTAVSSMQSLLGIACFGLIGGAIGYAAALFTDREARSLLLARFRATHPEIVLIVPALAVLAWGWAVRATIGAEAVNAVASAELQDNLRLLAPDSPLRNLGYFFYGVLPLSIASVAAVIWLARERPRLGDRGVPAAWTILGWAAFSTLGRGAARYLTPIWPGFAMLGGLWLARWIHESREWRIHRVAVALMIVFGIAQAWWYGVAREGLFAEHTPRAIVRELLPVIEPGRFGTWRLDEPAVAFYAGFRVPDWEETEGLLREIRSAGGGYVILAERAAARGGPASDLAEAISSAGLTVHEVRTRSPHRKRNAAHAVAAWRIDTKP